MKTISKLSVLAFFLSGMLFKTSLAFSQCFNNLGSPPHTEVQSYYPLMDLTYNSSCSGPGSALSGVGINQSNPQYILDIVGNYVGDGVNVSSGSNKVGYSIGGNMVLWHAGNISNIYVGVDAGNVSASGINNTFVGEFAGNSNSTGNSNTFMGYGSGESNAYGTDNTFIGASAGGLNVSSGGNTFVGAGAGYKNTAGANTFIGYESGASNISGTDNSCMGAQAGYSLSASTAGNNTFSGYSAGYSMSTGYNNTDYGYEAGYWDVNGAFNTFIGDNAGNLLGGNGGENTGVGYCALYSKYFNTFIS